MLQGVGRPDLTGKLNLIELPLYAAMIWLLARSFGLVGVALAWTLRVFVDTVVLWVMARRNLAVDRRVFHTPILTWTTMGTALLVGALLPGSLMRLAFIVVSLVVYLPLAWYGLITPDERQSVRAIVRRSLSPLEESSRQAA